MKKFAYIIFFVFAFFGMNLVKPFVVSAVETITVATWNIGGKDQNSDRLTPLQRQERMAILAQLIKERGIEIIYLQEFRVVADDFRYLLESLRKINYPMYGDAQPYNENGTGNLVIVSKYPLDAASKQFTYSIRGNRSAQTIIARDTPIGWLRLANMHTHNTEPCNNLYSYLTFYSQFDKANTLLGGDINLYLNDKPISYTRSGDNACKLIDWDDITISCNGSGEGGICKGLGIDWFFVREQSDLVIQSMWVGGWPYGISDGHHLVIATVSSKSPKMEVCPNKTDLTGDSKKDIYDINALLSLYGAAVTTATKASDINCDNQINQTDLSMLLSALDR